MTLWKSTMGADLSADEEIRILDAWYDLEAQFSAMAELPDPGQMLDFVTDMTMAGFEVRRAIGDAWNAANARAFPAPTKPHLVRARPAAHTPLDITEEELMAALAIIRNGDTE